MSQENVEIVRQVYEAAAGHDAERIFALYDPDVELDASRIEAVWASGVYRGHQGLRDFFREWNEAWEGVDYSYDELIDAGDQVVSIVTRHGRGRASGAEVERPFALVWTVRDGKVVRVVWFLARTEALEAAGLSE
jgi:ketosteroid isomerase-like protein